MDAKPQRPRVLRIYDENMPTALPGKTLHQRTKSVPAFSTLQSGASKVIVAAVAAANKKILGEVNTNAKVIQAAKDDSAIGKKANNDIKSTIFPLAQPAVRPTTAKSFSTYTFPTTKDIEVPAIPVQEPARKLVVKKSTKVLRDVDITETVVTKVEAPINDVIHVQTESFPAQAIVVDNSIAELAKQQTTATSESAATQSLVLTSQIDNGVSILPQVVKASMPTAQYIDEEEIEYVDEDGFTTAQSFGLRGGSMGGVTTVLVPKATDKTRAELEAAKLYVNSTRTDEDIDDEEWDTSMVAEYSEEIFEYMRKLEDRMLPNPRYMDQQQEIQWSMRAVLVDWVVQVHQRFNLLPETLFLSINYIDRFLSNKVVSLGKLQLVGATALFIAAKFEEVNCPTLQEIIFMVDGGYTVDELLKAERFMLSMLQFDLGWPGPMSFLRRISKADDYDLETRTLAKYFLEITIMDERFVGCTPSFLAAGAHCMARMMLRKGDWTIAHVAYSNYTLAQLRQLLNGIWECCENPQKHHISVYEKYTDKRYKRASTFVEGEMLRGFSLRGLFDTTGTPVTMY